MVLVWGLIDSGSGGAGPVKKYLPLLPPQMNSCSVKGETQLSYYALALRYWSLENRACAASGGKCLRGAYWLI
jgi:hypothetical protein